MPRAAVLVVDTTLYHPTEGKYTFPAGSPDPGALWTEKPGGEPIGRASSEQTRKDLAAAEERFEQMSDQLVRQAEATDKVTKERDEALARIAEAEERASQAESRAASAEAQLEEAVRSRDEALSSLQKSDAALAAAEARAEAAEAEAKGSAEQLAQARSEIAKVDPDGDGHVGGRPKKPSSGGL